MNAEAKLRRLQRQVVVLFLVVVAMVGLFVFSSLKPSPVVPPTRPVTNGPSYWERTRAARDAQRTTSNAQMQRNIDRLRTPIAQSPAPSRQPWFAGRLDPKPNSLDDYTTGYDGALYRNDRIYPKDHPVNNSRHHPALSR